MLEATLTYFYKNLTGETKKERSRSLKIWGGYHLDFGPLRIDLRDPTLQEIVIKEVPNTPEENIMIKDIEDALAACEKWDLTDEEFEDLMQ